jgi:hypothetical protein
MIKIKLKQWLLPTVFGAVALSASIAAAGDLQHLIKRDRVPAACGPHWGYHQTCWRRFSPMPPCETCSVCPSQEMALPGSQSHWYPDDSGALQSAGGSRPTADPLSTEQSWSLPPTATDGTYPALPSQSSPSHAPLSVFPQQSAPATPQSPSMPMLPPATAPRPSDATPGGAAPNLPPLPAPLQQQSQVYPLPGVPGSTPFSGTNHVPVRATVGNQSRYGITPAASRRSIADPGAIPSVLPVGGAQRGGRYGAQPARMQSAPAPYTPPSSFNTSAIEQLKRRNSARQTSGRYGSATR